MRFEDLNWFDVERYLETNDRLMIVIGACEQHGYLSLLTDVKIPMALADAASEKTGVLVAPPLNFGSSPYFLAYPGTISLRLETMLDVVEDIVSSVHQQGFKRLLILNGHGGNDGVRSRLFELASKWSDLQMRWYSWWQSHSIEEIVIQKKLKSAHANWLEAFPFTIVADLPEEEKLPPNVPGILGAKLARELYGDGVFGGNYSTDGSTMEDIFQAALADVLNLLRFD